MDNKVLLTGVAEKLSKVRETVPEVPYEIHDFAEYLSKVADDNDIVPEGMLILIYCALDDLKRERCGFANKVEIPENLINEKARVAIYLSFFPIIIDKIASPEFAKEFRMQFEEYFGKAMPPREEKEDFGVTIIEEGVVDISNKDKAQVLMELYNNSHPIGLGFLQYNPAPMTIEQARDILKQTQEFDYLAGRVMKISLKNDKVYTAGYNRDNGYNAAEKAISSCPNIN